LPHESVSRLQPLRQILVFHALQTLLNPLAFRWQVVFDRRSKLAGDCSPVFYDPLCDSIQSSIVLGLEGVILGIESNLDLIQLVDELLQCLSLVV
jgi:hypothetical protein